MKLALQYEMQRPSLDDHKVLAETMEQCILADQVGFDYLWFVEHHFLTGFSASPCPDIVFADEPTGELDNATAISIATILRDIALDKRVTVVVATHDLTLARMADMSMNLVDEVLAENDHSSAASQD